MQKQRAILDQKGRIMLPKKIRKAIDVKPGQSLSMIIESGEIRMKKIQKLTPETDHLLWDIHHPAHSKVRVTRKLLEKLEEDQWSGR